MRSRLIDADSKALFSNFGFLIILQIIMYALPLVTLPYLVKKIGVEKYGLVMFVQSFIMYFNIIVDFGFNLSATREISINRNNKKKTTEIFSNVLIIKTILLTISFIILSIIVFSVPRFRIYWYLYYFAFIYVIGQAFFPVWYFQGIEKMKYITICKSISGIVFTILIFILVRNERDYIWYPLINGLGSLFGSILSLFLTKYYFHQRFLFTSYLSLKKTFLESCEYFLSRVSVSIYTSSNSFILGLFSTNSMVAYYSIAEKLYQAMQQIYQPLVQALYPYIAKTKNMNIYKKVFITSVMFNILLTLILFGFDPILFPLVFSGATAEISKNIFHILLVSIIFVVPSLLLGYPLLGALGYAKQANRSVVFGSISHLFFLMILILFDFINVYSVAWLVAYTEFFVFCYRLISAKKFILKSSISRQ